MRYSLTIVGLLLVTALCDAAVVQRRYRNTEEILVPVTVIQDGDEIKETGEDVQPQVKSVTTAEIAEDIAKAVDEEQKLEAVAAVVEAERRIDEGILEEEIKEVVAEENGELLKALYEKDEKLDEAKEEKIEQALQNVPAKEPVIQPDSQQTVDEEKPLQQIKIVLGKDSSEEVVAPVDSGDSEAGEPEGTLRQVTQATPSQTTTQQNFVQQFIQNSPLGQFFNQITGQNNQGQVANDDAAGATATPAPTVPAFLAPAISTVQNAAQSVVNSTTSAFQGLTNLASTLTNQFQSTLSGLGGQQSDQQSAATTARPQGPFQQLVSTIMGNNNQAAAAAQPAPQQQGPLQGLLNIFQGNNNNNRPQGNTPSADIIALQPGKEPDVIEQANDVVEEATLNTADNLSNDIRNSAEVDDSFEDVVQPDEMIVVQDDASPTQEQDQEQGYVPK